MLADYTNLPYAVAVNPGVLTYALPSGMKVYDEADLDLVLEEADGTVGFEPVLGTHYTVAIAKNYSASITFLANTELVSGRKLVVDRWTDAAQPSRFSNLNYFPGETAELQLDRVVAMVQDLRARATRSLLARRGESLPELPAWSALFGNIFYPNADGSGWSIIAADDFKALAEDLGLGASSAVLQVADLLAQIEQLADIDTELVALAALAPDLVANLASIVSVAAAIADGDIANLLAVLAERSEIEAADYVARVGTDYADNAYAIQAFCDDSASLGVTGIYNTQAPLRSNIYARDGMKIVFTSGYMNFIGDAGWVSRGTSNHKNQCAFLTAATPGDTTYPEDTVELIMHNMDIRLDTTDDGGPTTAVRWTGLRNFELTGRITASTAYATTTVVGAHSAGGGTLEVADITDVAIGMKIVVVGDVLVVRGTWDGVSKVLPLGNEDGSAAVLLDDVVDGQTVYIGRESVAFDFYRDNRDGEYDLYGEQSGAFGGCWLREVSTNANEGTFKTDNVKGRAYVKQTGPSLDEAFSIFHNSQSAGIYNSHVDLYGIANARLFGATNGSDEPDDQHMISATVNGRVLAPVSGGGGVRLDKTSTDIKGGKVITGPPRTTDQDFDAWGVWCSGFDGSRRPPKISNFTLVVSGDTTGKTPVVGMYGDAFYEHCHVETNNGAQVDKAIQSVINGGVIGGEYCDGVTASAFNVAHISGGAVIHGKMVGCQDFDGRQVVDPAVHSIPFTNSSATANIRYRGIMELTDVDALDKAFSIAAVKTADLDYQLKLLSGGAVPTNADLLPANPRVRRQIIDPTGQLDTAIAWTPALYFGGVDALVSGASFTIEGKLWFHGDLATVRVDGEFTGSLGSISGTMATSLPAGILPRENNVSGQPLSSAVSFTGLTGAPFTRLKSTGQMEIVQWNGGGGVSPLTHANIQTNTSFVAYATFKMK